MQQRERARQAAVISDRRGAVKVTLIYVVVASLWVWGSDRVLYLFVPDLETFHEFEIYKGWLFVFVTTGLLFWILSQFVDTLGKWEETLEHSRDHLRETFDSMGTAIAMTDPHGYYTYFNPAYLELFGYSSRELLGKPVTITGLHGESPERTPAGTIAYAREHKEGWRGEALRIDKRGRVIPVYLTVSPLYTDDGELYGFLGDMVDLRSVKEWPPHLGGFALSLQRLALKSTFEELASAAVIEAVADAGAEVGLLALFDEEHRRLQCRWSVGYEEGHAPEFCRPEAGLWGKVIKQRRTLWIDEAAEVDTDLELMPGIDVEAVAIVPVKTEGECVGLLMIGTRERSHAFGEHQINMLEAIAGTVAAGYQREQSSRGYLPPSTLRDTPPSARSRP